MPILHSVHLAAQHARSTAEAIDYFGGLVHAGKGLNIMIGDASGDLVAIERGHDRQVVRRPADDALYFANHYVTPEMRAAVTSRTDQENSEGRGERYRCLLTNLGGGRPERSAAGIRRLISDHGPPVGPCQHGHSGMYTRYACIMRPRLHEMMLFHGAPCSVESRSYFV
jgi:hypothetical protein